MKERDGITLFFVDLLAYMKKKLYLCRLFGARTRI